MVGVHFKLELKDGTPADPPTVRTAVPIWRRLTIGDDPGTPEPTPRFVFGYPSLG
jgi:hypothetical protein